MTAGTGAGSDPVSATAAQMRPGGRPAAPGADPAVAARELDDARYYLRHGCPPCAERHFGLARRHGATEEEIAAVRAAAAETAPAAVQPPGPGSIGDGQASASGRG